MFWGLMSRNRDEPTLVQLLQSAAQTLSVPTHSFFVEPGGACRCNGGLERSLVALHHDAQPLPFAEAIEKADAVAVAGGVHVLLELVPESLPLLLSCHRGQCLDRHPQCPASGCQRARDDAPIAALAQQLLRDREAGGAADVAERGR